MKKLLLAIFGALILAGVGAGFLFIWSRPQVAVSAVKKMAFEKRVRGTGELVLLGSAEVRSPLAGRVSEVCVEEGEKVKTGQVLVQFEETEVFSQLKRAQAALQLVRAQVERAISEQEVTAQQVAAARLRLEQAEREKKRMEFLLEQGAIAQKDCDAVSDQAELVAVEVAQAEARLQALEKGVAEAQASLGVAQAELDYWKEKSRQLVVVSPQSGTVVRRMAEPGAAVNQGELLLEVGDPVSLELELLVAPQDLPQVKIGDQVEIRPLVGSFPAAEGKVMKILPHGKVITSSLGVEEAKGVVGVRFIKNAELFRSGYKVRGEVIVSRKREALVVPEEAVFSTPEGEFIYVVTKEECLKKRKVALSACQDGFVEVLRGLREGEKVVVKSDRSWREGQKIRIKS